MARKSVFERGMIVYTRTGSRGFKKWVSKLSDEERMEFLRDLHTAEVLIVKAMEALGEEVRELQDKIIDAFRRAGFKFEE